MVSSSSTSPDERADSIASSGQDQVPAIGLRERKKIETRRAIENAALDLFETVGFDRATIGDVAERAGISPRTFFYYFETKEDVVLADHERRSVRLLEELRSRPGDEAPWSSLRASFMAVAADYQTEQIHLRRRFGIIATNPSVQARSLELQARWEDALAAVLEERFQPDEAPGTTRSTPAASPGGNGHGGGITPRLLAAAAIAAMRSSQHYWVEQMLSGQDESLELPPLVADCFDRFADGLADL